MKTIQMARCLAAALLLLAGMASAQSVRDADHLRHYPSPERVRADIIADAGDARPEEIDGRVAGRLQMLAETLEETFGGKYGNTSFENVAPAEAKRLHALYMRQFENVYNSGMPPLQAECKGTLDEQARMGTCARVNFMAAVSDYRLGDDATDEAARRYFPADYRERFVSLSPGARLRESEARNKAEQDAAQQRASAVASAQRTDMLVGTIGGLVFLLFSLGIAFVGLRLLLKAGRMGHAVGEYEFENRTDGGVVQFESYEDAKRHRLKREGSGCLGAAGLLLLMAGGVMSFVACMLVSRALFA